MQRGPTSAHRTRMIFEKLNNDKWISVGLDKFKIDELHKKAYIETYIICRNRSKTFIVDIETCFRCQTATLDWLGLCLSAMPGTLHWKMP